MHEIMSLRLLCTSATLLRRELQVCCRTIYAIFVLPLRVKITLSQKTKLFLHSSERGHYSGAYVCFSGRLIRTGVHFFRAKGPQMLEVFVSAINRMDRAVCSSASKFLPVHFRRGLTRPSSVREVFQGHFAALLDADSHDNSTYAACLGSAGDAASGGVAGCPAAAWRSSF